MVSGLVWQLQFIITDESCWTNIWLLPRDTWRQLDQQPYVLPRGGSGLRHAVEGVQQPWLSPCPIVLSSKEVIVFDAVRGKVPSVVLRKMLRTNNIFLIKVLRVCNTFANFAPKFDIL